MVKVFSTVGSSRFRTGFGFGIVILGLLSSWTYGAESSRKLGDFTSNSDVGQIKLPGSSEFLPDKAQYRIQGSGANIWAKEDAFQFLWKKTAGDLVFRMDVDWVGEGKLKHRKACAMVRQDLEADSPYVDVAVHGDGLIALQYRKERGGAHTVIVCISNANGG
jgi:TolB protein